MNVNRSVEKHRREIRVERAGLHQLNLFIVLQRRHRKVDVVRQRALRTRKHTDIGKIGQDQPASLVHGIRRYLFTWQLVDGIVPGVIEQIARQLGVLPGMPDDGGIEHKADRAFRHLVVIRTAAQTALEALRQQHTCAGAPVQARFQNAFQYVLDERVGHVTAEARPFFTLRILTGQRRIMGSQVRQCDPATGYAADQHHVVQRADTLQTPEHRLRVQRRAGASAGCGNDDGRTRLSATLGIAACCQRLDQVIGDRGRGWCIVHTQIGIVVGAAQPACGHEGEYQHAHCEQIHKAAVQTDPPA